jgi:hypothetical protein
MAGDKVSKKVGEKEKKRTKNNLKKIFIQP